jgi:membrane protein
VEAPPTRTDPPPTAEQAPPRGGPNLLIRLVIRLDRFQRQHRWLALPLAVNKRFGEHDGTRLAATVSYYSFFSVFPLLLVAVTVLGLVLEGNPQLRQDLLDGAVGQIPLIGSQLTAQQAPLRGNVLALVIGLATALWAGMGAAGALQQGLQDVADVPMYERPNFALKRLRVLLFLIAIAVGLGLSVLLSNLATLFGVGLFAGALGVAATLAVNVGLVLAMYTVLPAHRPSLRQQLPGALVAGVLLVVLQQLGSFVVRRFIAGASDTYGTFALVIVLLSSFHLVSRVLLLSAQLNAVLTRQLWPRRLIGDTTMTDGDRRALLLDVQRVQRDRTVGYAVTVDGTVGTNEHPLGDGS